MKTITVKASKTYDVIIGKGILSSLANILKERNINSRLCIITDKKVASLYLEKVMQVLENDGYKCDSYVVDGGENSKSGAQFLAICEFLAQKGYTRSDCLVALGGGVVGDLTGFVSATYLRGVRFVQVPTTLLAFADSSVGGKTAINLTAGKNLVGAFYQPEVVLCDITVAQTLDKDDYACGMAEIIKYGFIFDHTLLDLLENGMQDNAEEIIARCVDLKRKVVENDERDLGERMLLNFGHTLGHAIEKISNFAIMHGQAVAIGMNLITRYAIKNGVCDSEVLARIERLCKKYDLPTSSPYSVKDLIDTTLIDKKRAGAHITVVLPTKMGKCELKKLTIDEWKEFCND